VDASLTCSVGIIHDDIFNEESMENSDTVTAHQEDRRWRTMMKQRVNDIGTRVREKQKSFGHSLQPMVREKNAIFKSFIYALDVEPSRNPLFSRVWYVRHTLDEHSPLLKPEVRSRIKSNQGRWPDDLNDPKAIRSALMEFRQVVVTLNGTSMVTLDNVFYAKTYIFTVRYFLINSISFNIFAQRSYEKGPLHWLGFCRFIL
jgi:hypothetical protein